MVHTQPSQPWQLIPFANQTPARGAARTTQTDRYVLIGAPLAAAAAAPPPITAPAALKRPFRPGKRPFQLRILHFNDLHGQLTRTTRHGVEPIFARMVGGYRQRLEEAHQRTDAGVLLLAGGDDMVGALYDLLLSDNRGAYRQHAAYQLYSAAGVHAGVVGNHDLDMGPALLARAIAQAARFPLLSANLQLPAAARSPLYPAAILRLNGVRVGLIGLTTPAQLKRFPKQPVTALDPVPVARNLAQALRPYCDLCILLTHLGFSLQSTSALVAGAGDVELAQQLPSGSVDLIIGGHTHHALPEPHVVNGIPIVQAGMMGQFLGEVTLTIDDRGETAVTAQLLPTESLPVDNTFQKEQVRPLHREAMAIVEKTVGRIEQHPDFNEMQIRSQFAAGESAFANFISDAIVHRCGWHGYRVDFAAIDSSVLCAGLPGHRLTVADWFRVMPYVDTIYLVTLSGRQLWAMLADNARRLGAPQRAARGFAHFSRGIRYQAETADASQRHPQLTQATLFGRPIETQFARTFTLALPSFFRQQAQTGFAPPFFDVNRLPRRSTNLFLRQELLAYIEQHQGITRAAGARRDGRLHIHYPAVNGTPSAPATVAILPSRQ